MRDRATAVIALLLVPALAACPLSGFAEASEPQPAQSAAAGASTATRPRAREAGVVIGSLPTGPRNAIVDVPGVAVGHATIVEGDAIRTGVTAIVPHPGDLYRERVPAAIHVANGYGKLLGSTQVEELGELETPILLTGTLGVWKAADAMVAWMLARPGMEQVRSLNPVVGETNDGFLSDIRARPIRPQHVAQALESASTGNVEEGTVGAGTGTAAFGWKGGIGTSSRRLPEAAGGYTVGVLVQSNFGGDLVIGGVPVGRTLPDPDSQAAGAGRGERPPADGDGSIMIVVATDAPLDARLLRRLASRAVIGLGRTGASMSNGSGDYVIAFATAGEVRMRNDASVHATRLLANDAMDGLFRGVAEATEEAIVNSMFRATTVAGHRGTLRALPLERVLPLLGGTASP
ncbi:P1 family peptidase [Luteimonas sp. RD2P54]|uniref:P1 family peptidase n=1 Tax=Luteimonas endophytica TaxID=3042023 RepID=A0ABT6JDF2_9GAMM|nr:P1 family peptidase [Luteimonas endophytica]MDH5824853.1 P1 family peptidase [Luteimonas endophytica]